jgi:hypothetical protein
LLLPDGFVGPKGPQTVNPIYNQLVQNHPTAEVAVMPPLMPGIAPIQNPFNQRGTNVDPRILLGSAPAMPRRSQPNQPPPAVVGNVIVNNQALDGPTSNFTQSETTNIVYGNTIVVGYNDTESYNNSFSQDSQYTGYSISTDGGQTFTDLGSLPINPNGDFGDPVLARDNSSGTIYFSTLSFGSFFGPPVIQVFRSFDGGNTFQTPVNAATGFPSFDFPDKEWMTVDNFAGAGQGNVYVTFTDFGLTTRITLTRSTDGGNSFGPSGGVTIATGVVQGSFVVVAPDHSVDVFWLDGNGFGQRIMMRRSTDQGNTFGPAQMVAALNTFGFNGDLGLGGFLTNAYPHVAVNPVTGDLYVAYNDTPLNGDRADIYFTQSTDGGTTWSAPVTVNDDGTTTDQWQPAIAVKPNGTQLFIGWYDRRNDPGNFFIDTFGAVADIDAGTHAVTFQPNFRISTTSFPPVFGVDPAANFNYMGDYDTASADNSSFYYTWGDNRDATAPDVRFAKILTGFSVVASSPADGDFVNTPLTDFVVHFSAPYDPSTVQASALTVDSVPADSVTQTDATTLTFHYLVTPLGHEGPHTMAMVANAVESLSGQAPLQAFTATFYFDTLRLQVNSTSPSPGSVFNVPGNLIVQFNEAVDPTSVSTSNLLLNEGTVTAATVSADHTSVAYTIAGATDGSTLTVRLAAGTIRDADGNPGPDQAFFASYSANVPISPYPIPLAPKSPLGSLVYDPSVSAMISFMGDTDGFTINLNAGQTASVLVTPDANLQPSVEWIAPDGVTILGSATASGAGAVAALQTAPVAAAGTYTLQVSGANGTTGAFTAQLLLNAAFQNESTIGPARSDDTLAGAQDLSNAFLSLGNGASRAAVLGLVPGGTVPGDVFTSEFGNPTGVVHVSNAGAIIGQFNNPVFTSGTVTFVELGPNSDVYVGLDTNPGAGNGGEILHFDTSGNLLATIPLPNDSPFGSLYPLGFNVAPDGSFWLVQPNSGNVIHTDAIGNLLQSYFVGGFPKDVAVRSDGQVLLTDSTGQVLQLDPTSGAVNVFAGGLSDPMGLNFAPNGDLYVADAGSGTIYHYNSGGTLVQSFREFTTPEDVEVDQAGNIFVRDFYFAVNKFDPSGKLLTTTAVPGQGYGLGVVGIDAPAPPPPDTTDYYSFTLAQGQSATLALKVLTPGGQADLQLQNASGQPLALDSSPANSNIDEVINNFVAGKAGTYYVRITGNDVQYNLIITRGADFDTEQNNGLANAQPLEGAPVVLGNAGISSAFAKPGGPKVLYYVDFTTFDTFGQAFAALGITPTVATSSFDFKDQLAAGGWDLVVVMDQNIFDQSWDVPVINYVNGGGRAIVASFTEPADVAATFGAIYTSNDDQNPITSTVADPIWNGITSPFQLSNPGVYGTWSQGLTAIGGQSIGAFPNGDSALVIGNDRRTILNGFFEDTPVDTSQGIQLAENEINALLITNDADTYSVSANAGDVLHITTATPGGGPGQFRNSFDPKVNLYDPSGNLVASDDNSAPDGINAQLTYTVPTGRQGTYSVQVVASPLTATPTFGEFVLSVQGATGPTPPFSVTKTNPPGSSHLRSLPSITVDFNDTILLASLSASSLTVDGTPATSFTVNNAHEVTWTLPALPGGDEVPHTIAIAAGVLSDIQGTPISAFSETIYIDTVPPRVVGTSIEEGIVLPSGNLTYVVTFSEPMLTLATTASSFDLHGNFRNADYAPASFTWNSTGTVLTITYANLPDDAYKLTLFSNGFEDLVAFHLDGEPHVPRPPSVPSGNGVEGGDFFIDFALDSDTPLAYPTPLSPKAPSGSLIYDPTVTNVIAPAGDSDQFTLNVNAGQTITVVVQSATLQGTITLADPSGKQIGSVTAAAAGKDAVLQTISVMVGGTYTLTVAGASGTLGLFTAQIILNAAVQNELHGGPSDDTIATAQDLTNSFLSLGTSGASRAAVLGNVPGGFLAGDMVLGERTDQFGSFGGRIVILDNNGNLLRTITNAAMINGVVQDAELAPDHTIYLGLDTAPGTGKGGELLHLDLSGNLLGTIHLPNEPFAFLGYYYPFGFDVAPDSTLWVPQPNSGNVVHLDAAGNLIRSYFVGLDPQDVAVRSDGQIFIANITGRQVQQLDPVSGSVTTFAYQPLWPIGVTFASSGGTGDLVVTDLLGGVAFFDNFGNQTRFISTLYPNKAEMDPNGNLLIPFPNNPPTLVKFSLSAGLPLFDKLLAGPAVGVAVMGVDDPTPPPPDNSDYYSFSLAAGQSTTIALSDVGPGQANMDLENAAGAVLASGQIVGTSVDQDILNFTATAAGTYYVHVTGNGVQYNLVVTRAATFSLGNNHDTAHSQDATGGSGALGAIVSAPPLAVGTNFKGLSFVDTNSVVFPPDGALAVGNGFTMEGVNSAFRVTDMQGNNLLTESSQALFSSVSSSANQTDPYIVYDDLAQRWYVTIVDYPNGPFGNFADLLFAVSNDANPLHGFSLQRRIHIGPTDFLDFPKMGFNHDAIVITAGDYFLRFSYQSLQVVAIDKNALLSGTFTDFISQRGPIHYRAEVPAWMHGSRAGDPMYLVEEAGWNNGRAARVVTMTNILSNNPTFTDTDIPVEGYDLAPPYVDQPGQSFSVNTGDTTFYQADWRNGKLVAAQTVSGDDRFGTSQVRWYEFDTTGATPVLVQQGSIHPGAGISTYYPSIAINANGDLGLTYMESSLNEYVSMYVTGRQAGDPLGTMRPAILVAPGQRTGSFARAGDYSGIAVDPNGTTFWAENEYQGNTIFWSTYIASFSVSPPPVEDWYNVTLPQYDVLRLTTSTPSDGPGQFHNTLNPHIDVFDSSGNLLASGTKLADGRNEALGFSAPTAGTYFIRVRGQNGTIGEYFLNLASAGVVLLDPVGSGSLKANGNGGIVRLIENGGNAIVLDSNSSTAAILNGNAFATAGEFDITGVPGTSTTGSATFTGVIQRGMPAMADPLAPLPALSPPSQTYSVVNYSGSAALSLNPGTYVGGIHISGSGPVTLLPGIYYMQGGGFSISGTSTVTGTGVMIYNAPALSTDAISVSQGTLNLTAPNSGTYQGIAIFQDRSSTVAVSVSGTGKVNATGTVYAANALVIVSDRGVLNIYGPNSRLVSYDLQVAGNGFFDPETWIPEFPSASTVASPKPFLPGSANAAVNDAVASAAAANDAPASGVTPFYPDASVVAAARISSAAINALVGPIRTAGPAANSSGSPVLSTVLPGLAITRGQAPATRERPLLMLPAGDSTAAEPDTLIYLDLRDKGQPFAPTPETLWDAEQAETHGAFRLVWDEDSRECLWSGPELWTDRSDGERERVRVAAATFDLSGIGTAIAALVGGFLPMHSPEGEPSRRLLRRPARTR